MPHTFGLARSFSAALLVIAITTPVAVAEESSSDLHPTGTVDIDQKRVSFLISGNGGGGVLHYRGHDYPFTMGGLGVGGIGVSKLVASGTVYNMYDRSRFTGMYSVLRTGHSIGDSGGGKLWLKNGDGVILKLQGKSQGLALSLGADAVHISFK